MKRTISAMVGRGSVNPKSRKFYAKNTAQECSHLDITYFEEISRQCTMNSLTRLWSDTTPSRSGQTARLRTTTRRYALANRKSRSMRSSCKWATRRYECRQRREAACGGAGRVHEGLSGAQPKPPGVLGLPPHGRVYPPYGH